MNEPIEVGQLWKAARNPYPLKGAPWMSVPWEIGTIYEVVEIIDMSNRTHDIIGFKTPGDPNPVGGWEIGEDSFRLGFERVLN